MRRPYQPIREFDAGGGAFVPVTDLALGHGTLVALRIEPVLAIFSADGLTLFFLVHGGGFDALVCKAIMAPGGGWCVCVPLGGEPTPGPG
jgi:hypothetical protein